MVVRQASVDEVDTMLKVIQPLSWLDRDFYDIVAARLFAELLGWKTHRVRNEYCLVGVIDGVLAGIVNGRLFDEKHGISYHTLTLKRGLRVGAHLFASKMEHHIEYLGQDEVWIVAESPIGHRRWMIEYPLEQEVRGPARAGRRALLGADPRDLLQGQVAPGDAARARSPPSCWRSPTRSASPTCARCWCRSRTRWRPGYERRGHRRRRARPSSGGRSGACSR